MTRTRKVAAAVTTAGLLAAVVVMQLLPAGVVADIKGSGATVTRTGYTSTVVHGTLNEGGKSYQLLEQNPQAWPDYTPPCSPDLNCRHDRLENLVSSTGCLDETNSCLVFRGAAVSSTNCPQGACPNDREEVRLSGPTDSDAMNVGDWRYEKFSIRFDPSTVIAGWGQPRTIIAQVWQLQTDNSLGPPFFVAATNAGASVRLDWSFRASGDQTIPSHRFYTVTIPKGNAWEEFCWKMKASPTGPRGMIAVWRGPTCDSNLDLAPIQTAANYNADDLTGGPCAVSADSWSSACAAESHYLFNWGYTSAAGGQDGFDVRVGMYRPPVMDSLLFWLDDIKLTTSGGALP